MGVAAKLLQRKRKQAKNGMRIGRKEGCRGTTRFFRLILLVRFIRVTPCFGG
jgi:hypothetical protein